MTEINQDASFKREGETELKLDEEGQEPADPSSENSEGDKGKQPVVDEDPYKDVPFHKHPAWIRRDDEFKERFNDQEKRHQEDMESLRKELAGGRIPAADDKLPPIPSWFGGTDEQWASYQADLKADRENLIKEAEEKTIKRLTETKKSEDDRIKEANEYLNSEMAAIEADKTLNPSGEKVDANNLLQFVLDNDLLDSKGRWNYRAGWKLMRTNAAPAPANNDERKKIIAANATDSKPELKPAAFKTAEDFKKKRPW